MRVTRTTVGLEWDGRPVIHTRLVLDGMDGVTANVTRTVGEDQGDRVLLYVGPSLILDMTADLADAIADAIVEAQTYSPVELT